MNKKLKQILNRYPMLEEDRNYIANLANGGSSCNCPAVLEVNFFDDDTITVSDEEHDFIMKNYLNLIFKTVSRMNNDNYDYYKPYCVEQHNDGIDFNFAQNIYSITGDSSTNSFLYYNPNTRELKITNPPS